MKAITIIAAILISANIIVASNEGVPPVPKTSISGQVIDKLTGEALAGVKIQLENSTEVVYSDLDGNFELTNITPGSYKINSTLISYESATVNVDCSKKSNDLEIELDNK